MSDSFSRRRQNGLLCLILLVAGDKMVIATKRSEDFPFINLHLNCLIKKEKKLVDFSQSYNIVNGKGYNKM